MFFETSKNKWVLSKNGLRIALGRLVKFLEKKILRQEKKKWVLSKNGLRIAVGHLVKLLEKCFGDKQKIKMKMNTQNEKQI